MLHAAEALNFIYACLGSDARDEDVFTSAVQKDFLLAASLGTFFEDKLFRLKPKAHKLVESARHDVNPIKTWTYRDESFGHNLALLGGKRGGRFSMYAVFAQALRRFLAANKLPRFERKKEEQLERLQRDRATHLGIWEWFEVQQKEIQL